MSNEPVGLRFTAREGAPRVLVTNVRAGAMVLNFMVLGFGLSSYV